MTCILLSNDLSNNYTEIYLLWALGSMIDSEINISQYISKCSNDLCKGKKINR